VYVVTLDAMTWKACLQPEAPGDRASHPRPRARLQNLTRSSLDERAAEHGGRVFHLFFTIDRSALQRP
jgi:hypothetical protein